MTIFTSGGANPSAQGIPGVYVNVQPPPTAPLPGAPSDILGIVGVGSWGPVNSPVPASTEADASVIFGNLTNRKFDLVTAVHVAAMQGASNFRLVRGTDGSDTAATVTVQTNGGTATAKYTGTDGAKIKGTIGPGTKAATKKIVLTMPGRAPETFDNIVATAAANASWIAIAAAINGGIGTQGPSQLIVFSAGASTTAPVDGTFTLTGGADGVASVTQANLVGADGSPRTGIYALRGTGMAAFFIADNDDSTTWAAVAALGLSEAAYAFMSSPSGDTISNFATTMASVGIDTPWAKVVFGDWTYILDGSNNLVRAVSPHMALAGRKVAIGPHNSLLNKPLYGINGTQRSAAIQRYSSAELQLITLARGDVVIMQSPGGDYPSSAFGRNSSSDGARNGDNYTTMTDYLAHSLDQKAGTGQFIGRLLTSEESREAKAAIGGFLQGEWDAGRIGNETGTLPYSVDIDNSRAAVGVQRAIVQVQYLKVIRYFLIDLTGGETVQIADTTAQALAA